MDVSCACIYFIIIIIIIILILFITKYISEQIWVDSEQNWSDLVGSDLIWSDLTSSAQIWWVSVKYCYHLTSMEQSYWTKYGHLHLHHQHQEET